MTIESISEAGNWMKISAHSVLFTRKTAYLVGLLAVGGGSLTLYSKVQQIKQRLLQKKRYKTYRLPKRRKRRSSLQVPKERKARRPPERLLKKSERTLARYYAQTAKE